ncbi:exported protein of unknown function [Pararobbsia alpina]|uniref:hypothetical protein n=1 Tax=Pararobbsia alpina TaxID=621374 RepID=UPI0039A60976
MIAARIFRHVARCTAIRVACFVACMAVLVCASAHAYADADPGSAPQTRVRVHLDPAGPVVAGTEVKLVVDLLTTTYFTDAPDWPLFNLADAVVSLPDEQATNLSETIDGVRWFGVSRAYRIAPQAAKTFDIAPFVITLHPGGIDTPVKVTTPALKLIATLPEGAEGMKTFFATTALTATQQIAPAKKDAQVGEAITRTITQRATGTQAMLVPPVVFTDVEGLQRTAGPASTHDVTDDRAGLVAGLRTDSVSYIAQRAGHYTLPAIKVEWWNATTHRREVIELPAVSISVAAAHERPVFDIPVDTLTGDVRHRILVIDRTQLVVGAVMVVALFALVWVWPRVAAYARGFIRHLRTQRQRWADSDLRKWFALRRVARSGRMTLIVPVLYRWLDRDADAHRARPASLADLAVPGDAEAQSVVNAVMARYAPNAGDVGNSLPNTTLSAPDDPAVSPSSRPDAKPKSPVPIDATTLRRVLLHYRRHVNRAQKQRKDEIPPLNPF